MDLGLLRYQPDEWSHDLDQLWAPLAALAEYADWETDTWLRVLGVEEFFDYRLLGQVRVFTSWLCLAASAVAATAARRYAAATAAPTPDPAATAAGRALAATALELAISLQELRWSGATVGNGAVSSAELVTGGRTALGLGELDAAAPRVPDAVCLVAGWLAHSGSAVLAHDVAELATVVREPVMCSAREAAADVASVVAGSRPGPDPLAWGTAHLVERLAGGLLDDLAAPGKPDDPPARACANVLLVSGKGDVGMVEARRQRSFLRVPGGTPVPDLARLAFIHANPAFLSSLVTALDAAEQVEPLTRAGEVVSWSLQLPCGQHPLAERAVTGRSAGLASYVAFRSLSSPAVFAPADVAFTGQVTDDGQIGAVQGASGKIGAAGGHRIRLVIHPAGQAWRDPLGVVQLEGAQRAEDAVIAAAPQLRGVRCYLEAACRLVAPEPWLQTWLNRQVPQREMPLLQVMCRQLHGRGSTAHQDGWDGQVPGVAAEPDVAPCAAHMLAQSHPALSFALSAQAGAGSTMAAKRMVAEAARRALDDLRAITAAEQSAEFVLPLYIPLRELPTDWDDLVRAGVDALHALAAPELEVAAALAAALRGEGARGWRALVVVDGTDRTGHDEADQDKDRERAFVAMVADDQGPGRLDWRPRMPAQVVLGGRSGSPAHQKATEALRRARPGAMAAMGLDPLPGREIDRFVSCLSGDSESLTGRTRDLAANPLLLALSVIAGHPQVGDSGATDLFDRGIDVLLSDKLDYRRSLAEIAFRAAMAKGEPAGEFALSDLTTVETAEVVAAALEANDAERARAVALDRDERRALQSAEEETHLVTASGGGWQFFHDRAFAFLVADRIARHAADDPGDDDSVFGALGPHLGDPEWSDVVEATGRLLELHSESKQALS